MATKKPEIGKFQQQRWIDPKVWPESSGQGGRAAVVPQGHRVQVVPAGRRRSGGSEGPKDEGVCKILWYIITRLPEPRGIMG